MNIKIFSKFIQTKKLNGAFKPYQCDDCEYLFNCDALFQCVHNDLWPMGWLQILGNLMIVIIIGISTVGGLGGGIEKVPVLMVMLNYSQKTATYYSYALMFGANFANFFMLIPQRHPELDRPIIDYDIALILLPTTLLGSALGSMLNKVLPDILLIIIFIILMSALVPGLIIKANIQRLRDLRKSNVHTIKENLKDSSQEYSNDTLYVADQIANLPYEQKLVYAAFERENTKLVPLGRFFLILLMFLMIQFVVLLRGGQDQKSFAGIRYCSETYWLVTASIALLLVAMTFGSKWIITSQQQSKIECYYFKPNIEIIYDWTNYLKIWSAGMAGGVLGGMLGVGSGSVMVPLLILLNVNSRVAAATSGFSKLFIAGASVMLGYLDGQLSYEEILFFMGLALLAGLVLTTVIYHFVNKYKRQSSIIYIVAGFLVLNVISAILYIIKESIIYDRWRELTYSYAYC